MIFSRIQGLLKQCEGKVTFGGSFDRSQRYIEPTILDGVAANDDVMGEEVSDVSEGLFRHIRIAAYTRNVEAIARNMSIGSGIET